MPVTIVILAIFAWVMYSRIAAGGVDAIILLAVTRPRIGSFSRVAMLNTLLLGVSIGLSTLTFTEAIARIPLGTASAIEFLGPLSVAAVRAHRRSALVWPALALVGVVALTQPWLGELNVAGIAFAAAAACSWAGYIIFTQRVGTQENGLQGLALSIATAAVVVAPFGAWHAVHALTPVSALRAAKDAGRPEIDRFFNSVRLN